MYACAVTRDGRTLPNISKQESRPYASYAAGDVTKYDTIRRMLQRVSPAGVIWAATSSGVKKGGGDPVDVDYKGAHNTAKACIACDVPKLAFISAGCVTRPNSLGSIVVNKMAKLSYGDRCGWVDAKVAGEYAVRDLYNQAAVKKKKLAYVIVRPAAALSNKPPVGVNDLIVMRGDLYSSATSISRTNVAQTVVAALLKGRATDFTTFEVCPANRLYKNDDGNLFDLLCLPTQNQKRTAGDLPPELVHRDAHSYEELLDGLVTDQDLLKRYRSLVSDYRGGEGVPPVEEDVTTSSMEKMSS
jgi:hypothetical protein